MSKLKRFRLFCVELRQQVETEGRTKIKNQELVSIAFYYMVHSYERSRRKHIYKGIKAQQLHEESTIGFQLMN